MDTVTEASVTGADVNAVVNDKLLPALTGVNLAVVQCACISLLLTQFYPAITEEDLTEGIQSVSGYMVTWLSALDDRLTAAATGAVVVAN